MPAIDRKCFDCKQTTSHGYWKCFRGVNFMSMTPSKSSEALFILAGCHVRASAGDLAVHEVDFNCIVCVCRSECSVCHTIDLQQVQVK